jgi:hypothetical protein
MARFVAGRHRRCDAYHQLPGIEPPRVIVGQRLLQQPWNAALESRLRVYRHELSKRGYSLFDVVLGMSPGCAGLVSEWSLSYSLHHLARLPARPCDLSDVAVTGTRCKEKAAVRYVFVNR